VAFVGIGDAVAPPPRLATASTVNEIAATPARKVMDLLRVMLAPFALGPGFHPGSPERPRLSSAGRRFFDLTPAR
jgi:hypothetical protein